MTRGDSSFFDTFNARFLDAEQVAATFVPSLHFEQLSGHYHALLIGPRGSGKTTLLKMLQPRALSAWNHPQSRAYRARIDYTGVFIPADVSWGAQLESLGYGVLSAANHRTLSIAAFTTHVLGSLADAFLSRTLRSFKARKSASARFIALSTNEEAELVRTISEIWRLEPAIPSIVALKQSLVHRLVNIGVIANQGSLLEEKEFSRRLSELPFLHLNIIESVAAGISIFNDVADEPAGKWALLFDEIEIAPQWIQDALMRAFRSVDQRILIKLAISPVSSSARLLLSSELAPAGREDVREVELWYSEKQQAYRFCRDLWVSLLQRKSLPGVSPRDVLGPSYFDPEDDEEGVREDDPYRAAGPWATRFADLAARDSSFAHYLKEHRVDPSRLHETPIPTRDRVIRKVAPLVAVREYFRAGDGGSQQRRSRKTEAIYGGADSLFAITEGNPRWFIGMTGALLSTINQERLKISPSAQAVEIEAAATRFLSMLRTIPIPDRILGFGDSPLTELLESVGDYFFKRVVLEDFRPDPPLCFTVDSSVSSQIVSLLEIALNRGAIVYIPEKGGKLALPSLRGHKFRLCYLLAAKFRLPLRLGKVISLSTILGAQIKPIDDLF